MQAQSSPIDRDEGGTPPELELADGSRLVLEDASVPAPARRIEGRDERISLEVAMQMQGQPFAGYRLQKS